jgi:hypothetical protein
MAHMVAKIPSRSTKPSFQNCISKISRKNLAHKVFSKRYPCGILGYYINKAWSIREQSVSGIWWLDLGGNFSLLTLLNKIVISGLRRAGRRNPRENPSQLRYERRSTVIRWLQCRVAQSELCIVVGSVTEVMGETNPPHMWHVHLSSRSCFCANCGCPNHDHSPSNPPNVGLVSSGRLSRHTGI